MPFDAQAPAEVTARDRMIRLRDFLAALPPKKFDYSHAGWPEDAVNGECGSPACIGGWARAIFRIGDGKNYVDLERIGVEWLGLTHPQAETLMFHGPSRYQVRPKHAVKVLDHYLATGKIDWSVAK